MYGNDGDGDDDVDGDSDGDRSLTYKVQNNNKPTKLFNPQQFQAKQYFLVFAIDMSSFKRQLILSVLADSDFEVRQVSDQFVD